MIKLSNYEFTLPEQLIATEPASPRDSSRLFVYDSKQDEVVHDTFFHLDRYLPKNSLLVFNNTKVVPARLWLRKKTGGKIQVLLMMNEFRSGDSLIKGIVDRTFTTGITLYFQSGATLTSVAQDEQFFFFQPSVGHDELWKLLFQEGVTPIPPYIKGTTLSEETLREKYQSILAKHPASVAAPTASLHFTPRLLSKLSERHIARTEVTLHVGAGTFSPLTEESFLSKKLFTEYYHIDVHSATQINKQRQNGHPVISVGTTTVRTLESAAALHGDSTIHSGDGSTNIFIHPPYPFKVTDALITNFHVPRSSLILLVDAFLKHKKARRNILDLYNIAVSEKYRFYSFGDGMLIY